MNKDTFQGDWNLLKGKVKEKWGKLTDNDLTEIKGKRDQLLGLIQKRYGLAKEKAEDEIKNWEKSFQKASAQQVGSHQEDMHHSHSGSSTSSHPSSPSSFKDKQHKH